MDVIVSARHFTMTEATKVAAENAVHASLDDLGVNINTVRVTLDIQESTRTHKADMLLSSKNMNFGASSENIGDINKAIAEAADKLRVQVKKTIEKKQDHRDRTTINDVPLKDAE